MELQKTSQSLNIRTKAQSSAKLKVATNKLTAWLLRKNVRITDICVKGFCSY